MGLAQFSPITLTNEQLFNAAMCLAHDNNHIGHHTGANTPRMSATAVAHNRSNKKLGPGKDNACASHSAIVANKRMLTMMRAESMRSLTKPAGKQQETSHERQTVGG